MVDTWWRPFARHDGITVVHVDLTPHERRDREAQRWLDEDERERARRFLVARPRREFRLCRAALRALLCRRLGCANDALTFATARHGKPFALVEGARAAASFSVSHSGAHGLIAVGCGGCIGVDVEERTIRHDVDGVLGTAFAPEERAELAAASGPQKAQIFFRLWTMKEALIKARGTGLALDTASFTLPEALRRGSQRSALFRFPQLPACVWRVRDLSNPDFAAALAYDFATRGPRPSARGMRVT